MDRVIKIFIKQSHCDDLFCLFLANSRIKTSKDGVPGIWTRGRRMVGIPTNPLWICLKIKIVRSSLIFWLSQNSDGRRRRSQSEKSIQYNYHGGIPRVHHTQGGGVELWNWNRVKTAFYLSFHTSVVRSICHFVVCLFAVFVLFGFSLYPWSSLVACSLEMEMNNNRMSPSGKLVCL